MTQNHNVRAQFYRETSIHIVPDTAKGKPVFWFVVSGHPVTFVSSADLALRLACQFIDVIRDKDHAANRNYHMSAQERADASVRRRANKARRDGTQA